jgi:hypothetical protein
MKMIALRLLVENLGEFFGIGIVFSFRALKCICLYYIGVFVAIVFSRV